jgi:flagellar protein FlaI
VTRPDPATGARDTLDCGCVASVSDSRLVVDAGDCPQRGMIATAPACREAVTAAFDGPVDAIAVVADGRE